MRLAANPDERLSAPSRPPANRVVMAASLALCLLIHASAIYFLIDRDNAPASAPTIEEIPVELVTEPPPEPPAPPPEPQAEPEPAPAPAEPEPEPQQTAQALDEKPADDAPRDSADGQAQQAAPDEASKAPAVAAQPTPPPAAQEARANDAASAQQPTPEPPTESAMAAPDKPEAEALARAELRPAQTPPTPTPPVAPDVGGSPVKTPGDKFAAFQPLPDYQFSSIPQRAPVTGGQAATTYLSTIFGMVRARMRVPSGTQSNNMPVEGEIVFQVDRTGKLIQARIARPSGSSALDSAALASIRAASPFPPTPTGTSLGLRYSYSAR